MTPERDQLQAALDDLLRTGLAAIDVAIAELRRLADQPDARKLLEEQIRWQQLQRAQMESAWHRAAGRLQ